MMKRLVTVYELTPSDVLRGVYMDGDAVVVYVYKSALGEELEYIMIDSKVAELYRVGNDEPVGRVWTGGRLSWTELVPRGVVRELRERGSEKTRG